MHDIRGGTTALALVFAVFSLPSPALAQRAKEDAVAGAKDAFGTTVGLETSGIYTQDDTRGFSPKQAGNVRLDGIYYDQVASLSSRMRQSTAIRLGFAAEDYPFPAPTGVVDNRLFPMPRELGASVGLHRFGYWGGLAEVDLRVPVLKDRIGINAGAAWSDTRSTDGTRSVSWNLTLRPVIHMVDSEFAPFVSVGAFPRNLASPLVVVPGDYLPKQPKRRVYLGQKWARPKFDNLAAGATFKSRLSDDFYIRSGLFHSGGARVRNFAEVYTLREPTGLANHLLIADPNQDMHSTSGEIQGVYLFETGKWKHRVYFGFRGRSRHNESGGSDYVDLGLATYGIPDPSPRVPLHFREVNVGKIRQTALLLGYVAKIEDFGTLNLGLQKARYRGTFHDAVKDTITTTRDNPLLYNAMASVTLTPGLSAYIGAQRGLEDSGSAPENAANPREQLPATRTTQYEGGLRRTFDGGALVVNAFQITKPYFSFGAGRVFTHVGTVRHRGIEASLAGHLTPRLNVVAGAVLMKPRVSGPARDLGLLGARPAGTPSVHARVDLQYKTDLAGGFTPIATFTYASSRAVGDRSLASLGGKQLMIAAHPTLDLGFRHRIALGRTPVGVRAMLNNVFDHPSWSVVAANTLKVQERRRFTLMMTADF